MSIQGEFRATKPTEGKGEVWENMGLPEKQRFTIDYYFKTNNPARKILSSNRFFGRSRSKDYSGYV